MEEGNRILEEFANKNSNFAESISSIFGMISGDHDVHIYSDTTKNSLQKICSLVKAEKGLMLVVPANSQKADGFMRFDERFSLKCNMELKMPEIGLPIEQKVIMGPLDKLREVPDKKDKEKFRKMDEIILIWITYR